MRVWVASLILYVSVYVICELLRYLLAKKVINVNEKYLPLVYEFIGTVQVCAPMFDVNIVLENYGLQGVVIEITFIELMNLILLRDASADPCPLIIGFFKKQISVQKLFAFVGIQFTAAYLSYIFVLGFWKIGLHPKHLELLKENCESDLSVTMLVGSLVEAGGLIANKLAEVYMEQKIVAKQILQFTIALVAALVTVVGIFYTGMYANPIVAWACTFNCGHVPHLAHFVVYWVSPIVAHLALDKYFAGEEEHHKTDTKKTD
ncbi:unnamed protein product [Bursaphelenchus okinawaensis]|uniref:Aquaporin n=1 Tax=Bursaphelenchus okinawaensis TaxID=465554 RepID=A0A811KFF3_9BILA|nr:unnamed protein product [Bursaphelenchus okinawaensis]CAG9103532.1 unnamed protein product [Bursaphelenchus okinawaensis]